MATKCPECGELPGHAFGCKTRSVVCEICERASTFNENRRCDFCSTLPADWTTADMPHCMRCSKKLIEDRGICADCEVYFLDDAVRLKQALEVALRDERIMFTNLTSCQIRCSELLEEIRATRAQFATALGSAPVGASRWAIADAIARQVMGVLVEQLPVGVVLKQELAAHDHMFQLSMQQPNGAAVSMKGACSEEEAARLTGFLTMRGIPTFAMSCRDDVVLEITPAPGWRSDGA